MSFETKFPVAWADCDPAGIVFYPNYFTWFDTTFQRWLLSKDLTQAKLQQRYGIIGTGILDTAACFLATATDGEDLMATADITTWSDKSFRIAYQLSRGETPIAEGHETRGWLAVRDGRVRALSIPEEFRNLFG